MSKPVGPRYPDGPVLNVQVSKDTERDFKLGAMAIEAGPIDGAWPSAVECVSAFQSVRNQGGYGACVGYGITDAINYKLLKRDLRWCGYPLSPMLTWMGAKEADAWRHNVMAGGDGTSIKAGLDVVRKLGCVYTRYAPMGSIPFYTLQQLIQDAAYIRMRGYVNLGGNGYWHRDVVRWLASDNQAIVGMWVDSQFMKATTEILKAPRTDNLGGHCCRIVGVRDYDPNNPDKAVWKIGNSWGLEWGDKGYVWASHAYMSSAVFEVYGVNVGDIPFYEGRDDAA